MNVTRFRGFAPAALRRAAVYIGVLSLSLLPAPAAEQHPGKIRLVVCGDDIGVALSFLDGAMQSYQQGVLRCVNAIVPGPWFPDAVRRLGDTPGIGVGLHLALTSEWDGLRYGPLTSAPTLVDPNGYLFHFGPELLKHRSPTGRVGPDLAEVEREMRAQIEMVKRRIPRVAWIWPHQLVAYSTPEFRSLTERLGKEYGLPLLGTNPALQDVPIVKNWADFARKDGTYDSTAIVRAYIEKLGSLKPGTYFTITHPALDTQEVRALRLHDDVAARRSAMVRALTDPELIEFVKQRGIELVTPDEALQALQTRMGHQ